LLSALAVAVGSTALVAVAVEVGSELDVGVLVQATNKEISTTNSKGLYKKRIVFLKRLIFLICRGWALLIAQP
jgi:hypothetical protein